MSQVVLPASTIENVMCIGLSILCFMHCLLHALNVNFQFKFVYALNLIWYFQVIMGKYSKSCFIFHLWNCLKDKIISNGKYVLNWFLNIFLSKRKKIFLWGHCLSQACYNLFFIKINRTEIVSILLLMSPF